MVAVKKNILKLIIITAVILLCYLMKREDGCKRILDASVIPINVKGIVLQKYVDSADHALQKIIILQNNQKRSITAYDFPNYDSLYKYIQYGDSITKKSGDNLFKIKRGSKVTYFRIECDIQ